MALTMSLATLDRPGPTPGFMSFSFPVSSSATAPSGLLVLERLLRNVFSGTKISIQEAERLQGHLHKLFLIRTVGDYRYILKCMPSREAKTLRCEHKSLETESRVLDLVKANTHVPIPQRIAVDMNKQNPICVPYLLKTYIHGTPLSSISPYISVQSRNSIDRSLGSFFWQLSSIRQTSFGLTPRVFNGAGYSSWREAFLSLLECALRDGEDMLVSLPYDSIRYYTTLQAGVLDVITEPRLVALEAGEPHNVLIDESTRQVTGLLGWAHVVWGDPFMASVFASATDAFWDGYGGKYLVGEKGEQTRQMLYTVYRSIVAIVRHHARPRNDGKEFEARRMLNWSLHQLAAR